jgi:hypothetical protein
MTAALRARTWLGDAAEVIDALGLTSAEDVRRIGLMLGLEPPEREAPVPASAPESPAVGFAAEPPRPAPATVTRATRLHDLSFLALPRLEPAGTQPLREPAPGAPVLPEEDAGEILPTLPFRPLLRPRTAASVVAAAVRTWGPGSRIDERRAVAELARGRPIREFPHRPVLSMYRGVRVLVDLGEALEPYGRDQQYVVDLVRRVVGTETTSMGSFENCPSRGVRMRPRRATVRGRPVLVLTDLGLGGPPVQPARASVAEWHRYARGIARAGSAVIALVPYPLAAARRALTGRIAVIPWDRASVSAAQRARRRAS